MRILIADDQSAEKKSQDDGSCQAWAKTDTGIEPAAVAAAPVATTGPQGERARGAVRGAAAGAVIGAVAHGDSGRGAATGATAGVIAGGARSRRNQAALYIPGLGPRPASCEWALVQTNPPWGRFPLPAATPIR